MLGRWLWDRVSFVTQILANQLAMNLGAGGGGDVGQVDEQAGLSPFHLRQRSVLGKSRMPGGLRTRRPSVMVRCARWAGGAPRARRGAGRSWCPSGPRASVRLAVGACLGGHSLERSALISSCAHVSKTFPSQVSGSSSSLPAFR